MTEADNEGFAAPLEEPQNVSETAITASRLVVQFAGWSVGIIGIGTIGWMSYITSQLHAMPGVMGDYVEKHEKRPHAGAVERYELDDLTKRMDTRLSRIEQKLDAIAARQ